MTGTELIIPQCDCYTRILFDESSGRSISLIKSVFASYNITIYYYTLNSCPFRMRKPVIVSSLLESLCL